MPAAFQNHAPPITALIADDPNIEEKAPLRFTALALAIGERKFWSVQTLLEHGADLKAKVQLGKIASMVAKDLISDAALQAITLFSRASARKSGGNSR